MKTSILLVIVAALAGCRPGQTPPKVGARAELRSANGEPRGRAVFYAAAGGVEVEIDAVGLTPGMHGVHVHRLGKCDPPSFESAGPHFNPGGRKHGLEAPAGAHAGDMPSLAAGPNGTAHSRFLLASATLDDAPASLVKSDGTALVIHEKPDDQKTDPSGGSGARVACGVIAAAVR